MSTDFSQSWTDFIPKLKPAPGYDGGGDGRRQLCGPTPLLSRGNAKEARLHLDQAETRTSKTFPELTIKMHILLWTASTSSRYNVLQWFIENVGEIYTND